MQSALIVILIALDLILIIPLYVTICQVQINSRAIKGNDIMAREAVDKADRNAHKVEDCCKAIQLISRDTSEAYTIAAGCRNELTRLHMAMRKETEK